MEHEAEIRRQEALRQELAAKERQMSELRQAEQLKREKLNAALALREELARQVRLRYLQKLKDKKQKKKSKPAKTLKRSEEAVHWMAAQREAAVRPDSFPEDDGFTPSKFKQRRLDLYFSPNEPGCATSCHTV